MRFLKPLATILAVLLALLILNSLIETYRWDKRLVEEMNKQGFELISETTGQRPDCTLDVILSLRYPPHSGSSGFHQAVQGFYSRGCHIV